MHILIRLFLNSTRLGGEIITVGSDAHIPKYIGYDFETYARDILTATGFRYYCTFEQMKPVFHKL